MGLFGRNKKHKGEEDHGRHDDQVRKDIEEVMNRVHEPTNVRMSHVKEPQTSEEPVWRNEHENTGWDNTGIPQTQKFGEEEKPAYAPLFVKINRYRGIISSVIYMKNALKVLLNSFAILKELDRVRDQTNGVVNDTLNGIEKKLIELDNDLIRPTGFNMEAPSDDYSDHHNVEATVSDLRSQIKQLKNELEKM